jgi:hypothetical protein
MRVSHTILKCVAFLGLRTAINGAFRFYGSAFFLGLGKPGPSNVVYLVTERHVIDKIRATGVEHMCVRLNLKAGRAQWFLTRVQDWFVHPEDDSTDIAILHSVIGSNLDHSVFPRFTRLPDGSDPMFEYALGDEVFITGLFRWHHGESRNEPIVRVGNLASFVHGDALPNGNMVVDRFLIEARSIGGLSGSPVFLNLSTARLSNQPRPASDAIYIWLGIIQAHYAPKAGEVDDASADTMLDDERINSGIAIVVAAHKVDAVIAAFNRQNDQRPIVPVAFFGDPGAVPPHCVAAQLSA